MSKDNGTSNWTKLVQGYYRIKLQILSWSKELSE